MKRNDIIALVAMTCMSAFLIWLGQSEGSWLKLSIGALGFAFFGFGGAFAIWRSKRPATAVRPIKVTDMRARADRPLPTLSDEEREAFDRLFAVLSAHGVFAPEVPDIQALYPGAADAGEPFGTDAPIDALFAASYFDPMFQQHLYDQNLRFHHGKTEQNPDVIAEQITDLVALSQGAMTADKIDISYEDDGKVIASFLLNETPMKVQYHGAGKYLSSVLFQEVAAAYEAMETPYRFAGLHSDSGLYITRLARGDAETINTALAIKSGAYDGFFWLDDPSIRFEAGGN